MEKSIGRQLAINWRNGQTRTRQGWRSLAVGMDLRNGRSICTREKFTDTPITSNAKMHPNNVRFFWEDVACKYWGCAERTGMRMGNMQPALLVMLAKAHSWSCQVPYLWCIVFKFKTFKKTRCITTSIFLIIQIKFVVMRIGFLQ